MILPTNATLNPQQPTSIVVQPFTTGLAAGVYNGTITLEFSDGQVLSVNVQVIVTAEGTSSSQAALPRGARDATSCTPAMLLPQLVTLGQAFAVSAGWPVALGVIVTDNCGNPLTAASGSVTANFSNGDPQATFKATSAGYWEGSWSTSNTPLSQVTLTLTAKDAQNNLIGTQAVVGGLQFPAVPPAFPQNGVVNVFGTQPYVPLAPGGIISIYGTRLAESILAAGLPPPGGELVNSEVFMAGHKLPLYYVSDGQVSAVVPVGLNVNTTHQVYVQRGLTLSSPVQVEVAAAQPVIYPVIVDAAPADDSAPHQVSSTSPAHAGDVLTMYAAGLGVTNPPLMDGQAAPSSGNPLVYTSNQVTVSFGSQTATPAFAGLAPGIVGLYQVNVAVPQGPPTGSAVPLTLTVADQTSPAVTIAIQ